MKETDMNKVLNGKIALVTGANSGMGMATTKALADMGATVVMLCRNEKRGRKAFDILKEKSDRKLDILFCNLGDFSSIRAFAEAFHQKYEKLDILTMKLIDLFEEGGRIVNVASGAHKTGDIHFEDINLTKGFNVIKAYSQSKLANVLFTRELARRLKSKKITVNCCHPGAVATNIGISRETGFGKTITGMLKPFFQTPEQGARTAIYLATSAKVKDITGQYFYKCKIAKSSKRSKDMKLAKRLFEFSEQIVGEIF